MPVAESIRKLGFRRWHERQLIEAHASLVTAFLGVILVAVCMDQFHWRDAGFKPLIMLVLMGAGLALCFKAVLFYFKGLFRAEHFAAQAVCSECGVYGVIQVLSHSAYGSSDLARTSGNWMEVRCKKCGHDWKIVADQVQTPVGKPL